MIKQTQVQTIKNPAQG